MQSSPLLVLFSLLGEGKIVDEHKRPALLPVGNVKAKGNSAKIFISVLHRACKGGNVCHFLLALLCAVLEGGNGEGDVAGKALVNVNKAVAYFLRGPLCGTALTNECSCSVLDEEGKQCACVAICPAMVACC